MSIVHTTRIDLYLEYEGMSKSEKSERKEPELIIVNDSLEFPRVSLKLPTKNSYIHIAAEIDRPLAPYIPIYLFDSERKRDLISDSKALCNSLVEEEYVVEATVFKAILVPPGRGAYLEQTDREVHIAQFDVTILIEVVDAEALDTLRENHAYLRLEAMVEVESSYHHVVSATNVKRIDAVDHDRDGVFLFNYFFAESTEQNIAIWEYTAGWFESETGLDNSTLLLPDDPEHSEYALINHCRWDSLRNLLPTLIFDSSFEEYVLENFEANRVAAMPILYKLA